MMKLIPKANIICYLLLVFNFVLILAAPTRNVSGDDDVVMKKPQTENKVLTAEDFKVPDHLEGVKLERDGHLNTDFRKEVLLGKNHEEVKNPVQVLTEIFRKADTDHDNDLTLEELTSWIVTKVKEHLDEAVKENFYLFTSIDKNGNGIVTWKEYHYAFMLELGLEEKYAKDHAENHKGLERKVREQILLEEAAFSETAHSDPAGLNIDEFLSFRHPERSHVTLFKMVNEIFNNLDEDGDNFLSLKEFTTFSNGGPEANQVKEMDNVWQKEREREFKENIDADRNGKVSREELLFYSDPQNPAHARSEARNLIAAADTNKSGSLSLEEILAQKDIFLGSKMVNTAKNFHDEF